MAVAAIRMEETIRTLRQVSPKSRAKSRGDLGPKQSLAKQVVSINNNEKEYAGDW